MATIINGFNIDRMAKHLIIAMLWADSEDCTNPEATEDSKAVAVQACKRFVEMLTDEEITGLKQAYSEHGYGSHPDAGSVEAAMGHDFWLTSQGHGAGFWDRDELEHCESNGVKLADSLTQNAKTFYFAYEQYEDDEGNDLMHIYHSQFPS